ncbi:TspO/MBR family protein [Pelagibacterium lacus]|uniref:Tryptophan-rich sensory protein n=1 Tax=Pelagibacterium lacus TaxID=2282655 RepID=A0A369W0T0_9HYPH|nr:TspO/MBR family protein [Pelagibacterium lacus]RDE08128.1 tryptophan-rich sensory protein [Pelagibacterium lacus]
MSTVIQPSLKSPRALIILAAFLVVVVGVGALIGTQNTPGPWYRALDKPSFNPPDFVFGPVWFTLYVLIAIAGWRSFMVGAISAAMGLWVAQMLLNWLWSPVFFGAENLWLALAVIVPMLVAILAFIVERWTPDRLSALLFVPYAAWVGFATLLNLSLAMLNS